MSRRGDLNNRRWIRFRLQAVGVFFALFFLILLGRAAYLQLFENDHLTSLARRELMKKIKMPPRRGIIFDRNQDELAVSLDTDSVYASPVTIKKPKETGAKLAKALGLKRQKVIKQLKGEKGFVWIARRIDPQKAAKVRELKLKGVGLLKEPRRFYPFTSLASHVLGFAGQDAKGLEGIERRFDKVLRGHEHTVISQRDALGRTIHLTQDAVMNLPEGNHLLLTLDKGLQYHVEKVLADSVIKAKAKAGQALVMIPQTGEILALASYPKFNPNVFGRYSRKYYRNRVVEDIYEPGSTFKLFVAAAALQSGKVLDGQLFDCENGSWAIGRRVIHDTHPYDELDLAEIVKYSSNIGIAKVGFAIGAESLEQSFSSFGFGKKTGIDLPGESKGILRNHTKWKPVDLANICFGQGVAINSIQLIQAVGAIANGGVMMRPFIVRAELDHDLHVVRETSPLVVKRVLSQQVAKRLTKIMVSVTQEGGTANRVKVKPFLVAGKTGTAQKLDPKGGYSHKDYISSFVGFLPAYAPKVVVLVSIDTPRKGYYGSTVAGPGFVRIAKASLSLLGQTAPSSEEKDIKKIKNLKPQLVSLEPMSIDELQKSLNADITPDFRGQTLRNSIKVAKALGLKIKASGWGRVVDQSPKPGDPVTTMLNLTLKPVGEGA